MIIPDHEIRKLAMAGMIEPYNEAQLNPASYDIRISKDIIEEHIDHAKSRVDGNIVLDPGAFILAASMEIFNLPDNIAAQFQLKSSWARRGLGHIMSGYCDPGWHGSALTMELKNYLQHYNIYIPVGECIGQMVFHRLESPCERSYAVTGRYNNDKTVTGAKKGN